MIGMSQIKKKFYAGMGIGIGIGVIGIAISGFISFRVAKSYEEGTNKNYNDKYTKMVIVAKENIMQGTTVTDDMVEKVRVHKSSIPSTVVTSVDGTQVAKYNITAHTTLSEEMLTSDIRKSDVRLQEINTVVMPTDLTEGEYVDIRIMYPNGTDYIVLAEKNVVSITGETMLIELNEDERLRLNGAIVDSFLTKGTKLYATKYADPSAQIKFEKANMNTIKEKLLDLIRKDLPEFVITPENNNVPDLNENVDNPDLKTPTMDTKDEQYVTKIYDFIVKYRNMAAATTATEENYQPNEQVISAMRTNPNIMKEAKEKLSESNRQNIEMLINQYKSKNEEEYLGVVSGSIESIQKQKEERNNLLSE